MTVNDEVSTEYFIETLNEHMVYDVFVSLFWKKSPKYRKFDRSMNDNHERGMISLDSWNYEVIQFIKSNYGPIVPINAQEMKIALDAMDDFFDEADQNDPEDTICSNEWMSTWENRHDKIVLYPIMRWVNLIVKNSKRHKAS